jgi:RNA polymerase sigma-70 factor (ECF subfamily)
VDESGAADARKRDQRVAPDQSHVSPEAELIASLRRGDEAAFMRLVERYQAPMVRLAQTYTRDRAVAEEVTQETWLAALTHLDQFAGRSSFKTWLFHILVNGAKARAQRERRSVPFSALESDADGDGPDEPSVAPERFQPEGAAHPGGWLAFPQSWEQIPEAHLVSRETRERILAAIEKLPANQRGVIRLRDVEGYAASEVCDILGLSEVNQRVLLHRARARVRQALETYFAGE